MAMNPAIVKDLGFLQLNMHRAATAAANLQLRVVPKPTFCMITEPCTYKNKVSQTPLNHVCVPQNALAERPRAAMFLPRDAQFVHLEHLSNADCAVVLLNTARGKVILASIYLDYNKQVVQEWLTKLMRYVDSKKFPTLLAFDSNAHSELYGPDTNDRGKTFEEFILHNALNIENRGDTPTFHAFRRGEAIESFIDVTATKYMIPLSNWRVEDNEFNGSDHHTISWSIQMAMDKGRMIRPWSKAQWSVFTEHIRDYEFQLPETMNARKIDKLLKRWYKVINEGLDKACPKREAKLSPIEMEWFGKDQKYLKNRAKRKYLAQKHNPTCPKQRKAYVKAKRAYSKACRRGKRNQWRIFVETTPNESNMSVLFKIAQKREKRNINTLVKADGTLTEPGVETIAMLTDAHFPAAQQGSIPMSYNTEQTYSRTEIEDAHDWIDVDLVRKAMKQFKPNKAAGPDGLKPIIFKYLPENALTTLTFIYKACISLCHTPKLWRETKVIFLPKPGKTSYSIPKSYRPISLSNFLLKTLERLVV